MQRNQKACPFLSKDCEKKKYMAAGRTHGKNMYDDHSNSSENPRERERELCQLEEESEGTV